MVSSFLSFEIWQPYIDVNSLQIDNRIYIDIRRVGSWATSSWTFVFQKQQKADWFKELNTNPTRNTSVLSLPHANESNYTTLKIAFVDVAE